MNPHARALVWFLAPVAFALLGAAWMYAAVVHYERLTGREFYGLAAQHYSVPDWKMVYHPGGEAIERWTANVPTSAILVTLVLLLVVAILGEWRRRRAAWFVVCVVWYGIVAAAFLAVAFWVSINVTGVFI